MIGVEVYANICNAKAREGQKKVFWFDCCVMLSKAEVADWSHFLEDEMKCVADGVMECLLV